MSLVYGIGINNQEIPSRINGIQTKEYKLWCRMLVRCTEKYWDKRPTYIGTTCSENFKDYAYFHEWCHNQIGFDNKDESDKNWHLDKDLLVKGNKLYSEDTCVFVPQRINTLLIKSNASRGEYPIGVYWCKNGKKFRSKCNNGSGKQKPLGYFNTHQEAFQAYKVFKEALIREVAEDYKSKVDSRLYQALLAYKVEITD